MEDLPEKTDRKTIYIIGGREHPFYAAFSCPRKQCKQTIHLEISPDFKKRWKVYEHEDGSLTFSPSVYIADSPCKCHYWIRNGHIVWCDVLPLTVPKENKTL